MMVAMFLDRHAHIDQTNAFISTRLVDGSIENMNIDGSNLAVSYSYTAPVGVRVSVGRLIFYLASDTSFDENKFGSLPPLSNGLQINAAGDEISNIKTNMDWMTNMYDCESRGRAFSKETKNLGGRWSFWKACPGRMGLLLEPGETFDATVRDDLTGLTFFFVTIQGASFSV